MKSYGKLFLILSLAILGFIYKRWLISLVPQPVIFDQNEYINFAQSMITQGIFTTSSRTYGYPLFLVIHFLIFGMGNLASIIRTQIFLDVVTGILLFIISYKVFKNTTAAYITMILQFFNPFTSAYTGMILTEVLACFLMVLLLFVFLNKHTPLTLIIVGLILGFICQNRPAFYFWSLSSLLVIPFIIKKYSAIPLITLGFFIACAYQITANIMLFQEFSLMSVDRFFARELYDGALLKATPLFPDQSVDYPMEMQIMYAEYSTVPKNSTDRKVMAKKYLDKGITLIMKDPIDYIRARFVKMWTMWQKENIFFYTEPGFEQHRIYTYTGNLFLLFFAFWGLGYSLIKKRSTFHKLAVYIIGYMTLAISISHAEPRLTIPAYPILFLYAGYQLSKLKHENT